MRVVNFVGSRYTVMNLVTNKLEDFHLKQLRPFNYDSSETDPKLVAYKDNRHFAVESIISHTGDRKMKSEMKFVVRWAGYDASQDSELPWKELRTNVALHNYLRENKMKSLIPKDFRIPADNNVD
jgi:hypothetical protein